jgi:hypothetical protein
VPKPEKAPPAQTPKEAASPNRKSDHPQKTPEKPPTQTVKKRLPKPPRNRLSENPKKTVRP